MQYAIPEGTSGTDRILIDENMIHEEVVRLRRHFHAHPELSWEEKETQKAITEYLTGLGLVCRPIGGTGVITEIRGSRCALCGESLPQDTEKGAVSCENEQNPFPSRPGEKILGIRADIDALPVQEETGFPFASQNKGVSHACGHDTHIAMALTAARILCENKDVLPCPVRFVFQPAEETPGDSGGDRICDDPFLLACTRMIAIHTWSKIPAGQAGICEGPVMASTDTFEVRIQGKGGHGAVPQEAIDPVPAAAEFIQAVQRIVSRETDPFTSNVVTIGSVHAGTTWNVIPDSAEIMGTTRSYDPAVTASFPERLQRIADGVALTTGTKITVNYHKGPDPVINDREAVRTAVRAAAPIFGEENIIEWRQMVGEDFACYRAPKCLMFLGGGLAEEELRYPQHSPHYIIDEKVLTKGVEYFLRYVFEYGEE